VHKEEGRLLFQVEASKVKPSLKLFFSPWMGERKIEGDIYWFTPTSVLPHQRGRRSESGSRQGE